MLHDVADAVMKRVNPRHEEKSLEMARELLNESGFKESEIEIIVDDAVRFHSCRDGKIPKSIEGKAVATADAVVHICSDFYEFYLESKVKEGSKENEVKERILKKIEKDFGKILFDDIKEEVRGDYEKAKAFFQ